jgi:hypothetical protein
MKSGYQEKTESKNVFALPHDSDERTLGKRPLLSVAELP